LPKTENILLISTICSPNKKFSAYFKLICFSLYDYETSKNTIF
jgi:hypothetical protein